MDIPSRQLLATLLLVTFVGHGSLRSQPTVEAFTPRWSRIGNSLILAGLPDPATGSITRVWYDSAGLAYAHLPDGNTYATRDFERWLKVTTAPPPPRQPVASSWLPETPAYLIHTNRPHVLYALGARLYRSDDEGRSWTPLVPSGALPLPPGTLNDIAVSSNNPDDLLLATQFGLWRSIDGGLSWASAHDQLPNLPVVKLLTLPTSGQPLRVLLEPYGEAVWQHNPQPAWVLSDPLVTSEHKQLAEQVARVIGSPLARVGLARTHVYAVTTTGVLLISSDGGSTWRESTPVDTAAIKDLFVHPSQPNLALAIIATPTRSRLFRTTNAGVFWDDLTANLPPAPINAVTADLTTGAVYVATDQGLYLSFQQLQAPGPAARWLPLTGLPEAPVVDVALDEPANRLFVAVRGHGIFVTLAPHRLQFPSLVSAADLQSHPAAPGSLLSFLGPPLSSATANGTPVPVLSRAHLHSQLQLPFRLSGSSVILDLLAESRDRRTLNLRFALPLVEAAPAIVVSDDGAPLLVDSDTGLLLDPYEPLHPGTRVDLLATGLGRVDPDWPAGLPAPLREPPKVVTPVRVLLDRHPVPVIEASLAPGYIGLYLVRFEIPRITNYGSVELVIEAAEHRSNPVRIFIEP